MITITKVCVKDVILMILSFHNCRCIYNFTSCTCLGSSGFVLGSRLLFHWGIRLSAAYTLLGSSGRGTL